MALRGGSYLTSRQPAISCDGKFILVCTGCTVSVLSVATGLRVAELYGHTDRVTSVVIVQGLEEAKSALTQAWTSSVDKTIRLWNFITAKQIKCIDIGFKIVSMVIPRITEVQQLAFVSVINERKDTSELKVDDEGHNKTEAAYQKYIHAFNGRILICNLAKRKLITGNLAKTSSPRTLVQTHVGNLVGMVDVAKIWIWKVPTEHITYSKQVKVTLLHAWQPSTVMAFDSTGTMLAAGDWKGQIMLWKNVGERTFYSSADVEEKIKKVKRVGGRPEANDDVESCTTYHWHHQEVTFLAFTSDSTYLLSGGLEAVLVMWQLETGKQQYLPRLAAPLKFITCSPDPSLFVISLADNALKFVNIGNRKVERAIQGIRPIVPCPQTYEWLNITKVALEHGNGRIVLPSVNLTVQFYDVFRDQHAFQIQVSPRNFISTFEKDKFAQSTVVTHVAFSSDSSVMVTVDLRSPEYSGPENPVGSGSFLKFWIRNAGSIPYILHTSVDTPHSGEVLSITYHPSKHIVVTCSNARDFKIWIQTVDGTKTHWRCSSAGSYKQKRMYAAAFSPDGTLLAVSAEEYITLWDPDSNKLLCVLNYPGAVRESVGLLCFVSKSPYLVSASYSQAYKRTEKLTVWNLQTLSVSWSYRLHAEGITADPESSHFVVLSRNEEDAHICLFKPETPVPVAVWAFKDGARGAVQFLPANFAPQVTEDESVNSSSKLLLINNYREYTVFDPYTKTDAEPQHKIEAKAAGVDGLSAFEAMYGPLQAEGKEKKPYSETYEVTRIKTRKPWGDLLNGPSHVLPPLTQIGEQILQSFLHKRGD